MSRFRFPMFLKFWIGCSALAALLIAGGVLVVRSETRMKSRGNYLEKHFKRYQDYQEGVGHAVSSGCFRLVNNDVIDLYDRVPVGTKVVIRHAAAL